MSSSCCAAVGPAVAGCCNTAQTRAGRCSGRISSLPDSNTARSIALRPKYMLYDEPTTGLDPVTSTVIDQLIVRTREALGVTSIVITHDMRSAYTVGDRIAMLYQGKIQQVGTVAEIRATSDPVVRQFIEGRPDGRAVERASLANAGEVVRVEGAEA